MEVESWMILGVH
ncbi:hypothetical protein LINPERPRIM_LOCUS22034 [Linum perenne]